MSAIYRQFLAALAALWIGLSPAHACDFSLGALSVSPATPTVGSTLTLSIPIDYQSCRNTDLRIADNGPAGLGRTACAASGSWDCAATATSGGITTSLFTPDNNGNRSTTMTWTYSVSAAGSMTITLTASPGGSTRSITITAAMGAPPTVTTGAPTAVTRTGATLNGSAASNGAATTVSFEYGTTTAYGSSVAAMPSPLAASAGVTAVSAPLTGLGCGSTYFYRAVAVNSVGTALGAAQRIDTQACAPTGPDHYEVSLAAGSLACLPTTVTVIACADASSPCTNRSTALAGATATLSASAGALGSSVVSFDASGVASTTLSHPTATDGTLVTVSLSGESVGAAQARQCCPDGVACVAGNGCPTRFDTAGFIVAAAVDGPAATVPTQTAGTASAGHVLRAVKTATTTRACEAALTGATTVDWAYRCLNPAICSAGNLMTIDAGTPTTIQRNDSAAPLVHAAVPMSFDANGNAPFSLRFADVGQVSLWARKTVNGATLSGSSNAFVVRPAGFTVSGIVQTAAPNLANPGAASAAGAGFVRAGEPFGATITARTSSGAAAPGFGRESPPEGVRLTPTLVQPAGGVNGTLSNGVIAGGAFAGGSASATGLAYSEVGIVTLTPSVADGDYLGTGAVTGTTTAPVGRFFPARFALSATGLEHRNALGCSPASTFTYLGENFRLGFTVTAQSTTGATTRNYAGAFAKLDPAVAAGWNLMGRDGASVFSVAGGRLSLGSSSSGGWTDGSATVDLVAQAQRAATPDGPFAARFGVAPVDTDGVALAGHDLDADPAVPGNDRTQVATVALHFGRLQLASAAGAADRPLTLPARLQAWDGSHFVTHAADSCTTVPVSAVSFGNLRRSLTVADTAALGPVSFTAGRGGLRLAAPTGGRSGSVDVALSLGAVATDQSCLQPWAPGAGDAAGAGALLSQLRGAWCGGAWDRDPAARASFGLPRGNGSWVYRRENH